MAYVKQKILNIQPSVSPDVIAYRIRAIPAGQTVVMPDNNNPELVPTPFFQTVNLKVDVSTIPALADANGLYDFYVSAVDAAGNESDFVTANNVVIDFLAPSPPAGISFS